ncbi:HU family DNA-binding protein [Bacteroides sp.]
MNERLYQQDFIDLLAEKHGMDKQDAEKFVKEFFLLIEEALEKDRSVKIKGFGTFKLVDVESRESVKVNTGERFQIQGYTKVSFIPDATLRDTINKPFAHFETVVLNENTVLEDTPVSDSDDENEDTTEEAVSQKMGEIEENTPVIEDAPLEEETFVEEVPVEKDALVEDAFVENVPVEGSPVEEVLVEDVSAAEDVEVVEETSSEETPMIETVPFQQEENEPDILERSQPTEPKLSAEEIIARELATSTPITAHERQIKKYGKTQHKKTEKSPVPYLITIIVIVLLLCGGALLFIYYPDLFDSFHKIENIEKPVDAVEPVPIPAHPLDTVDLVIKEDTVGEVVAPVEDVKEEPKIVVPIPEKEMETVKKEDKTVTKPAPFKPDSVSYIITGTKAVYTIKEGETLTRVALRFYGTKALWPYIVKYNPDIIKNPDHVPYGTTIKIPELVKK